MNSEKRTWCEISLDAIEHNINEYKKIVKRNTKILGVVKADAYGHGAYEVASVLEQNGADYLAVAFIDEALELRRKGITLPILILGCTDVKYSNDLIKNNITPSVYDFKTALKMSECAVKINEKIKIHIKIDTGMGRIGFLADDPACIDEIVKIYNLPNLEIEGIFTHFACADEDDNNLTFKQYERFTNVIENLEKRDVHIPVKHCCNSAAAIRFPDMHMDMIRVGICLYGLYPSEIKYNINLKPAMQLKSTITHIKNVEKGSTISYGAAYTVIKPSKIATVSIGYADGFSRILSGKTKFIVNGNFLPQVGKICMDQCMIDAGNVNNINVGDEAVIFGAENNLTIPIESVAEKMGTINYELLCIIGRRVHRCYTRNGKIVHTANYLLNT